ncbi:MAG: peptidylprolyl isomerase [Prolixibacteraceae bacterium]|jgi:peptidyl-prolyl cis-trans isomerase SurA|nr:peptidylprolyl isomerase [Prolixibacteraceae bacterium]
MERIVLLLLVVSQLFISYNASAKNDVMVTINGQEFSIDEYERIYQKNNSQLSNENDVMSPNEYIDLFINYKLKVIEAENQGLDTVQSFVDELSGYRKELSAPYMTDVTLTEKKVEEAYYRTTHPIRASHILLNVAQDASPADTLKAYKKAMEIREKFTSGEESFQKLAVEYSQDPSAKQNMGDLGYFKAFSMVTPFENATYNTPVGEVSLPVRTNFGYHIIYVTDKKESKGEIKVAHIMKMFPDANDVAPNTDKKFKKLTDSLYNELINGADFAELVQEYSDDQSTVSKNGEMRFIDQTFRVHEFADAAFELENIGDIHKPVRSTFGWHIIKLIDKKAPPEFEDVKNELTRKIKNDPERSKHSKISFLKRLKNNYNFKQNDHNIEVFNTFIAGKDTIKSIDKTTASLVLFNFNNTDYTVSDFIKTQYNKSPQQLNLASKRIISDFEDYSSKALNDYEFNHLEEKYSDFANLMQEYHDGMLLFEVMQEEVWDKAVQDSTGLEAYYQNNKEKYTWNKHFDGLYIKTKSPEAAEYCKQLTEEGITEAEKLKQKCREENKDFAIVAQKGKWKKGDHQAIDYFIFDVEKPNGLNPELEFVHGEIKEAGAYKTLDEARGQYISDYQNYLEDKWVEKLRKKYRIKVNKKALRKVESL